MNLRYSSTKNHLAKLLKLENPHPQVADSEIHKSIACKNYGY